MKIVLQTKKGEHTLNVNREEITDNIKTAAKTTKNSLLSGINRVIRTAGKGLEKAVEATRPDSEYIQMKQRDGEEEAKLKAAIAQKKAEIKALEQGV